MSDFYDACGRLVVAFRATKLYSSLYFQFVGLLEGFLNVERHLYSKKKNLPKKLLNANTPRQLKILAAVCFFNI